MFIAALILAVCMIVIASLIVPQASGLIISVVMVGLLIGLYMKNNILMKDMELLKKKLNITGMELEEDYYLSDEEIEKELEQELKDNEKPKEDN